MQPEIIKLLEQKLSESLRIVDDKTAAEIRNTWAAVNPSPACPAVGDVMKNINRICHYGYNERGDKAREAVVSTLLEFRTFVNEKFSGQIMEMVERHFPEDKYVALARNTKGVYERRQAPARKFCERAYEIELTAITAGSANLSRRAVLNIRTAVDELRLQRIAGMPTTWERVKGFVVHQLAVPVVKWVFGIIAMVIGAIILYVFGIKG
ncbi:MAG TPA: hypothetical protein VIF37_17015 [Methylobacter sp.]|jgi:hypothetical protein